MIISRYNNIRLLPFNISVVHSLFSLSTPPSGLSFNTDALAVRSFDVDVFARKNWFLYWDGGSGIFKLIPLLFGLSFNKLILTFPFLVLLFDVIVLIWFDVVGDIIRFDGPKLSFCDLRLLFGGIPVPTNVTILAFWFCCAVSVTFCGLTLPCGVPILPIVVSALSFGDVILPIVLTFLWFIVAASSVGDLHLFAMLFYHFHLMI